MKTLRTTKLFYGKWYYKVTLWFRGCDVYTHHSPAEVIVGLTATHAFNRSTHIQDVILTKQDSYILEMSKLLVKFSEDSFQIRVDNSYFSIYTNDEELSKALISDFHDDICESYNPHPDDIQALSNPKVIVCNQLPFKRYEYKVFVNSGKFKGDITAKRKFLEWMLIQSPKMTCTASFQEWFIASWYGGDRRYFLVDNEHTLLLLRMFHPELIVSVYKYVISDTTL